MFCPPYLDDFPIYFGPLNTAKFYKDHIVQFESDPKEGRIPWIILEPTCFRAIIMIPATLVWRHCNALWLIRRLVGLSIFMVFDPEGQSISLTFEKFCSFHFFIIFLLGQPFIAVVSGNLRLCARGRLVYYPRWANQSAFKVMKNEPSLIVITWIIFSLHFPFHMSVTIIIFF